MGCQNQKTDFGVPWPHNLDICQIFFIGSYSVKIWSKKLFSEVPLSKLGRLTVLSQILHTSPVIFINGTSRYQIQLREVIAWTLKRCRYWEVIIFLFDH